jgi:hypothetical protein
MSFWLTLEAPATVVEFVTVKAPKSHKDQQESIQDRAAPMGAKGSFALNGNHEMYADGNGYWKMVLPRMGLKERGNSEWGAGQWASFFCLENKHWRIIGLDTGYNSTRFDWGKVPVLQRSKWLRKTTWFKPGCTIPEALFAWLKSAVNPDGDKRGLILLSHHGPHSAFEAWYQIPAKQLAKVIHRPVIWFWGHEHRLAIYEKFRAASVRALTDRLPLSKP